MEYDTASEMSGIYLEDSSGLNKAGTAPPEDGSADSSGLDPGDTLGFADPSDPVNSLDQSQQSDQADSVEFTDEVWISQEDEFNASIAEDVIEDGITGMSLSENGTTDDITAITVGNASTDIIYEDDEKVLPDFSAFSQSSLQAASGSTRLQLDFMETVPAETALTFQPVEAQQSNNYYNAAKNEISRADSDWSAFGFTVTDGQFWNITLETGITETLVTIAFQRNEMIADKIGVVDWSDDTCHVYDLDEVMAERFEDGSISEILFVTDALHDGEADFGILFLKQEEDEVLADGFSVPEPVNDDSNVDGWITDQFDAVDDSNVDGWITEQFDTVEDSHVDGWIREQVDSADDSNVEGWITDQFDNIDERQVIEENSGSIEETSDETKDILSEILSNGTVETENEVNRTEGFILDEAGDELLEDTAAVADDAEDPVETMDDADAVEADNPTEFQNIENYVLNEIDPEDFEIHEIETEANTDLTEVLPEEIESETLEEFLKETETEAFEENLVEIETEVLEEILEENETEVLGENLEENETEALEQNLEEIETEALEERLEEIETETETELGEESLDETETETETESVWEEPEEPATEADNMIVYPAQSFAWEGEVSVFVTAPEGALPENTSMEVTPVDDDDDIATIAGAVEDEKTEKTVRRIDAVDITFFTQDGTEIEPLAPVKVRIVTQQRQEDEDTVVVHLDDAGNAEQVDNASIYQSGEETHYMFESLENDGSIEEMNEAYDGIDDEINDESDTEYQLNSDEALHIAEFETEQFSIYAVVYTVDFHWEVNGKTYDFSIPGGGFVSFTDLVEVLGIARDTSNGEDEAETEAGETDTGEADVVETDVAETQAADGMLEVTTSDAAKKFTADVVSVEFSNSDLVWVGKADAETTVGALKEANALECAYSSALTEDEIEKINNTEVESGDWALISMQPFTSEETLTVTMKDGEVFTIKVTDAQITTMYLSDKGELYEVTVTYGKDAQIPDGARLVVTEYDNTSKEYLTAWNFIKDITVTSADETEFTEFDTNDEKSGSFSLTVSDARGDEEETEENIIIAENVEPYTFGMTAFDLSIFDDDGNPIEPKAAVDVSILVKKLPVDVEADVLETSLEVQHLNESTGETQVETVASVNDDIPGEIEISGDTITADFTVESFSTYTITWGGGINGQQISNISTGDYIIYAQDASDGKYYALVPSTSTNTNLTSVPLTYANGQLSYSGSTNIYWHVTVGNSYQIYYRSGNRNYYLYPNSGTLYNGNTSALRVRTNSYSWNQYADHLYSGQDTFMRSNNGTFQVWNVSNDSAWMNKTNIYFGSANASPKTVTVHYGYTENGVFHEFAELPEGAQTSYGGPAMVGDQLDLRYDINGYEYVTSRLTSADGTDISNLLNTDSSSANAWKYRELTADNEYHTWNVGDKAYDYNASTELQDDVYVIYRKAVRIPGTGTDPSGEEPLDIDAPQIEKQKQDNGDGTYDIDLSITAESASNKKSGRANVVVVLDTSNSMKEIVDGDTKWELATNAIKTLSTELLGLNSTSGDSEKVEFTFVNFSNYVKNENWIYSVGSDNKNQHIYKNVDSFNNMIDDLDREVYGGGTCWDKAMAAAASILWNDNDPVYVVFVSDGDTISRAYANGRYDYWDGGTYHQDNTTDYNDTSKIVKENVDATTYFADKIKAEGGTIYTIGITGGGNLENLYRLNQGSVGYVADPVEENLHFNVTDTQGISEAFESIKNDILNTLGYQNVVATDGLTGMTQTALVNGNAGNFTYTVAKYTTSTEKLAELPAGKTLGSSKDANGNITSYTRNTGDDSTSYPYIKTVKTVVSGSQATVTKNNDGTLTITFPDGTSDTVHQASYADETKTVTWDFGEDYQLRDGYTYTVTFTVWPNQASYDLLAALRNGLVNWGDNYTYTDESGHQQTITFADYSEQIDQVGDDYALRSNVKTGNTVTYYKVSTETLTDLPDGVTVGTTTDPVTHVITTYTRNENGTYTKTVKTPGTLDFVNPEPMPLAGTELAMTKVWNDTLDRGHLEELIANAEKEGKTYSVTLVVYQNGTEYKRYIFQPVKKYYTDSSMTTEAAEGVTTEYFKYVWPSQNVAIAPALLVSEPPEGYAEKGYKTVTLNGKTYYVLNEGHSYNIDETDTDYHFEFIADPYYPSLIDSASDLTNVEFETNNDGSIRNGSTATVSGNGNLESFIANNSLTAELDITKKISDPKDVLTDAQEDAETFTYKVTLTVPKDTEANHLYAYEFVPRSEAWNGSTRIYVYGYQNSDADSVKGLDDDVARFNQDVFGRFTVSYPSEYSTLTDLFTEDANGTTKTGTIFITLKRNEIIRFTNLPLGTQYTIQEIYANLRQADPSRDVDSTPEANTEASNIEQQGYSVLVATKNGDPTVSTTDTANDTVSGTITQLDTRYYNQFTNTLDDAAAVNLAVKKHLEGYQWSGERYYVKLTGGQIINRFTDTQRYLTKASGSEDVTYTYASPLRFAEEGEYSLTFTEYDSGWKNVLSGTNTGGIQYGPAVTVKITVKKVNGKLTVTDVQGGTLSEDRDLITATITNRKGAELQLLKLGDGDFSRPLEGVRFKLYTDQDCADEHQVVTDLTGAVIGTDGLIVTSGDDSEKGMAYLGSLGSGTYYLKEIAGHDGYNLLSELITITIESDGTVSYLQSSYSKSAEGPDLVYKDGNGKFCYYSKIRNDESDIYKDNSTYTFSGYRIIVNNTSGYELPSTGGPGTRIFTILGSILTLGAGILLWRRRRMV